MSLSSAPKQVPYDERLLALSWTWLRDPEIKRLTDTPDFTRETQRSWFDSLGAREDYFVWGVELREAPVGAFGLKNVTDDEAEYWGYLGDRACWGQGIGQWMLERARAEAHRLGLQRLRLRVRRDNPRAVAVYERFGYRTVSEAAGHVCMELDIR